MHQVNIYEAKTHFSKLINEALAGEEVVIAKAGKPLVQLVPCKGAQKKRVPGRGKGKIVMSGNFDDPLPDEVLKGFES